MNNKMTTIICDLKGDKACAVTFTTDDALYKSCLLYLSKFKELGLKGTAAFTLDMIKSNSEASGSENSDSGTWNEWRNFMNEGYFDIANHTKSHAYLDKLPREDLEIEVNETRRILMRHFPEQKILCMANPYVVSSDAVDKVIKQQHYSARNGVVGFNNLNPNDQEWYHLNFQLALHDTKVETMNEWIDQACSNHAWLIELWHGVDGQGWEPPSLETLSAHLSYLAGQLDTVWNGTMDEVTQYIRERQSARVETTVLENDQIMVKLKTNLNSSLFNYPLTLKTTLLDNWTKIIMTQGNRTTHPATSLIDGVRCVIYDALPDAGYIILTKCG